MKAVDLATLEVSVISSSDFLPDSMVPKTESADPTKEQQQSPVDSVHHSPLQQSLNILPLKEISSSPCNASVKVCEKDHLSLQQSLNSLPLKEISSSPCNASRSVYEKLNGNSLQNGDLTKTKAKLTNGIQGRGVSNSVTSNDSHISKFNSSTLNSNLYNNVAKESNPPLKQEGKLIGSFANGIVNNGYHKSEDEKHSLESLTDTEVEGIKRSRSPPEDIPRYEGLQVDSGVESAASSWDRTVAEAKEHAVARLQEELRRAREELKLKDEEVIRLSRIREEVESELEDLTASLFQEAHNMVRVANERQAAAEKALRESTMQVEVLTAEVAALKTLVLTSTPSKPNPHLHPQIDPKAKDDSSNTGNPLFRKHRRSPSHFNLKYGRENSPPESPVRDPKPSPPSEPVELRDGMEVDPVLHREFLTWKQAPTTDQSDPFIARIYREDIDCCLIFSNSQLGAEVRGAVQSGTIFIEAVNEKTKTHFPKKCALLETPRQCQYRMRLGDEETWHSISQICRNRIIAVCDFLNYLNYIQRGLVKSSVHDIYWEIVRLRKEMVLARLGLPLSS